jgi:RNA polymerase sigma-70 factor (ECF subfamily)
MPVQPTARAEPLDRRAETASALRPSIADEHGLVARVRTGDRAAFDELVLTYCDPLCNFVTIIVGSAGTAEELVQEVFLKIWRMRSGWHIRSNLRSYLFGAAYKAALNECRRAALRQRWEARVAACGEAPMMSEAGEPADRHVETLELRAALRLAIQQMPPRCREAATLRFEHDLSCPDIAQAMGITVKAAERHASNALHLLRAALGPYLDR